MGLLRQPPEKIALYALVAYGLAALVTVFNVICSYLYFRTVAPGGGWIGMVIAVGIALLVNVIESGTVMIFLSADEAGHLFTPPRIQVPGFPSIFPKIIKFAIIGLFGFVMTWTYKVDLDSTKEVIQATGSVGWYIVVACVFGSEFLMLMAHALWGISKFGKANTQPMWASINSMLGGRNVVNMPPRQEPRQGGLAGEARRGNG